jgi:hypothetical protein
MARSCYRGVVARSVAALWRWFASRRPRAYLITAWVVFLLNCYPGYLSFDSSMQLFAVRTGVFTDYVPVMTGIWSLLEWIAAGPFPMVVLQSGLFLFGMYGILRHVVTARAAAVTAGALLLFPPVFSPVAVIWPESLMAGALLAGTAAVLESSWRWKATGALLFALACACKPEIALALAPLVFLGIPALPRGQRVALALGTVVAVALAARVAELALTDDDHHRWHQDLVLVDLAGTLRRSHTSDRRALAGLTIVDASRMAHGREAFDSWPLVNGPHRLVEPIRTGAEVDAVVRDWRAAVARHPSAYILHRWSLFKQLLGFAREWEPVYDGFGDPELLAPLHHRASPSDWQRAWNAVVHLAARTPLFKPWLYVILAVAGIALAWRQRLLRNLAISGLVYEIALFGLAPTADYRLSHWLVTTATIAIAAYAASRHAAWQRVD